MKVLLRDRKRDTARGVACPPKGKGQHTRVLFRGVPPVLCGRGVHPVLSGGTLVLCRVPLATGLSGVPYHGYRPYWGTPPKGPGAKETGWCPPVNRQTPVETISHRPLYAGGNKCNGIESIEFFTIRRFCQIISQI